MQNTTGYIVGKASEQAGMIKHGSKMIQAVANARVPKLTVVVGGSYGAGNYAMCGRGLDPRFIFAWPNSRTAVMGGAHLIEHAAGWMHGGLTASFEKLILDAEMLQMIQSYLMPIVTDPASLALETIAEVGPGGHFFGTRHTMDRYEKAFHSPMLSNWENYPNWLEKGSIEAPGRANVIWKQILTEYEQPFLDPGISDALNDYVARRKADGGAPMN